MTWAGSEDNQHLGRIHKGTRLYWSRRRCWHGEEVTMHVRSEQVPDGAVVRLDIQTRNGEAVATIDGLAMKAGALDHVFKLDLRDNPPAAGTSELVFRAVIDGAEYPGYSRPLYVDLEPLRFSI